MPGRAVTIDEAIDKIGKFSKQDAIDLIESSQGVPSCRTGKLGHPLDHCEMTTHIWPIGRFQNQQALLDPRGDDPGTVFREPDRAATAIGKGRHTMAWTDHHLIQAVRDLFLGNGTFTALHHLKRKKVRARLVYARPTSHTALALTSTSEKVSGVRYHVATQEKLSERYVAVLDHCAGGRLHLQTIFADPDNARLVRITVNGAEPGDVPFVAEFEP